MKTINRCLTALFLLLFAAVSFAQEKPKIKVLILTGQNNHNWRLSTPALKELLEQSGRFTVDVASSPTKADKQKDQGTYYKALAEFKPDFAKYDVIVSDYNSCETGDDWSADTQKSFEDYMKNGGGFVSYHAADNSFPRWGEFNKVIGIAGWGRPANFGNFTYYKDGKQVIEKGHDRCGSHGPQHDFLMVVRDEEHPITKGLPKEFMHGQDELYDSMQGPAENLSIKATALSEKQFNGTEKDEPMLMTIQYGKGRVFHTTLGHVMNEGDLKKLRDVSFIATFLRGTEWAATGAVTIPLPPDFPGRDKPVYR
ncbi:MAG: ThuA domain-containing protein [Planctomycetaceae bacterium]|jgi:type 1 glutamine amidotransferase|nr:ThuA domain-containing protein [Planctomycetaceae bacterium]